MFWAFLPVIFVVLAIGAIFLYSHISYPLKYKQEIEDASTEFNIPAQLIASVINAESGFDKNAISNKGAVGLMQIMPSTAEWVVKKMLADGGANVNFSKLSKNKDFSTELYNVADKSGELFDVKTNIRIGTYYLTYLINKFSNLETAICAFNAGEGTVANWLKNAEYSEDGAQLKKVPYKETKNYLEKVKLNLKIYEKKF